jgi:hypothetical protein
MAMPDRPLKSKKGGEQHAEKKDIGSADARLCARLGFV